MLTPAQQATLLANIQATPEADALYVNGDLSGLAAFYNAVTDPAFIVWKSAVSRAEIMQNGFDWVRVDNLSIGKARIWEWLFADGPMNAAKSNVRAGIDECWKGTQPDLDVRAAVYIHCKRAATRLEALFATGTGSDAVPATMAVEGAIGYAEFIGL